MGELKKWNNLSAKLDLSRGLQNIFVTCPLCGEQHLVDEPEEQRREWLYCDTEKRRVEFPRPIRTALDAAARSLAQDRTSTDGPADVILRYDESQSKIRVDVGINFGKQAGRSKEGEPDEP